MEYFGESFGVESLTNLKEYDIVRDGCGYPKVVDDSEEDYLYSLDAPAPLAGSSKGVIFKIVDDPSGILERLGLKWG